MHSQKPRRRVPSPSPARPASLGADRARSAPQIDEAAGPSRALTVGRRTAARDHGMLASRARRSRPSIRFAAAVGWEGIFPPCKPLKSNETELESRQIPVRRTPMQWLRPSRRTERVSTPRPSSASFAGNRGRRNFPIRNPLKRPDTAKESGRPSLFPPAWAGVRGTPRPTPAVSSLRVGEAGTRTRNDGERLHFSDRP
jgi:hypothetical protein